MMQLSDSHRIRIVASLNNGKLLPDHYLVSIMSTRLPPFEALQRMFRRNGVSSHFDGQPWKRHITRQKLQKPGEEGLRIYWVANTPPHIARRRQPIIDWAESIGYQVAIETEAVDFARAFPDVQRKYPIVAFGSSVHSHDSAIRSVAMLSGCKGRRELVGTPANVLLTDFCRVLLVKK